MTASVAVSCRNCGCGPRLPSLFVCWACYIVRIEASHKVIERELRDPAASEPTCSICHRPETSDAESRAAPDRSVNLALVEGQNVWTCMNCLQDEDDGESWKQ